MASYKELILKIGADTTGLSSGLESAKTSIGGLREHAAGLATIGAGLTASLTVPIVGIGTAAITAAGQMQQTVASFETLLGSGQAASAMLKSLEDFAKSTPFEFDQLTEAAKRMLAFGFEAEKVIPMLTAVGDSVAALGGNSAMVDRVTTALGQMQAKQKVSAEEMLQLTEAGIPAWDLLADAIGVSVPEAMKLAEQGAIDAGGAIDGLISGMSSRFGGLMTQQSTTLLGQISNIQDTFAQSLTRLGQALLPFAQQAVSLVGGIVDAFASAVTTFGNLPEPIQTAGIALAGLVAAAGPLLATVGSLVMAWTAVGPTVTAAGGAIAAVATGPVGVFVAAAAALGAGIVFVMDQIGILDPILAAIGGVFDSVTAAVSAVWTNLGTLAAGFAAWVAEIVNGNVVLSTLVTVVQAVAGFFGGALVTAFSAVAGVIKDAVIYHIDLMTQGLGWLKDKAVEVFNFFLGKGKEALGETAKETKAATHDTASFQKWLADLEITGKKSAASVDKFGNSTAGAGDKASKAKVEVFDLDAALRKVEASNRALEQTAKDAAKALANELARDARIASLEVVQVSTDTENAMLKIQGFTTTAADEWSALATAASMKTADIDAAFAALGLNTITELNTMATEAETRFNLIKTSGEATPQAINTAWLDYLTKRKTAVEAAGGELTTAETNQLNALLAEQNKFKDASVGEAGVFPAWATSVKSVMSGLSTDLVDALFPSEGGFSLSNIGNALTGIAGKFKDALAQPAKDALQDLIDNGISKLMGALDGVIGKLTGTGGVQSAMEAAFGGAAGAGGNAAGAATGGAPSVPTAGGGGGGGGGGGVMGAVNMITGIATAISSIFGNFQMAKMETTLNAIEESTRRGTLYLGDRADGGILGQLFRIADAIDFGAGTFAVQQIRDKLLGDTGITAMKLKLDSIGDATAATAVRQGDTTTALVRIEESLVRLAEYIRDFVDRPIIIEIDGQEIARAVGAGQEELRSTA